MSRFGFSRLIRRTSALLPQTATPEEAQAATPEKERWLEMHSSDLFAYEMLTLRDVEKDALMWQAPSLALTAQAFLLTIALNPQSPAYAVMVSSALGFVVAGLSMQLMARHRLLNVLDRAYLHYLESRTGLPHMSARSYFWPNGEYKAPEWLRQADEVAERRWPNRGAPQSVSKFANAKSYDIWTKGLAIFALLNAVVFLYSLVSWLVSAIPALLPS